MATFKDALDFAVDDRIRLSSDQLETIIAPTERAKANCCIIHTNLQSLLTVLPCRLQVWE